MLTLRPYQQAAIDAIYGYFAENAGHPLVVIPTAGGKSLVMAAFIEGVLRAWPDQRILVVTHVRELIAQNHAELIGLYAPLWRRRLVLAVLASGLVGAAVDSVLFLWLAFGSLDHLAGQLVGKMWMVGAAAGLFWLRAKRRAIAVL
jgi:hypothetical protein